VALVVGLGIPPWLELGAIENGNQRLLASGLFLLAAAAGVWSAIRREPLWGRAATAAYGATALGIGLFVTDRSLPYLLAYVVALMGMNVLLYHARAFGPVLAAFREEDAAARRARTVVLRSLAMSAATLAAVYGVSLALLPVFALEAGSRDPVVALLLAAALVVVFLLIALFPEGLPHRRRTSRAR